MARAGIYKADVIRARNNLIARRRYPSIDAVRTELGDTGSKATIYRYLKEIEEEEGGSSAAKVAVSEALQSLVARLAERLHVEAEERIEALTTRHSAEQQRAKAELQVVQDEANALRLTLQQAHDALAAERTEHAAALERLRAETIVRAQLEQQVSDVHDQLEAERKHHQSLDQKYQDARRSLEHFREAAKEQRDQGLRQHEQQVQYLQHELHKVGEALIGQQHAVASANQELARLANELGRAKHDLHLAERDGRELAQTKTLLQAAEHRREEAERRLAEAEQAKLALDEARQTLVERAETLETQKQALELLVATEKTRSDTQERLVEQFREQVATLLEALGRVDTHTLSTGKQRGGTKTPK